MTDINQTHVLNPKTGRLVKIGTTSWKKAVVDGHLPITDAFVKYTDNRGSTCIFKRGSADENKIVSPLTGKPITPLAKEHKRLIRENKLPMPDGYESVTITRKDGASYVAIRKRLKDLTPLPTIDEHDNQADDKSLDSADGQIQRDDLPGHGEI